MSAPETAAYVRQIYFCLLKAAKSLPVEPHARAYVSRAVGFAFRQNMNEVDKQTIYELIERGTSFYDMLMRAHDSDKGHTVRQWIEAQAGMYEETMQKARRRGLEQALTDLEDEADNREKNRMNTAMSDPEGPSEERQRSQDAVRDGRLKAASEVSNTIFERMGFTSHVSREERQYAKKLIDKYLFRKDEGKQQ